MDTTIFLAQAYSLFLLIFSIAMLIRHKNLTAMANEFYASKSAMFVGGTLETVLGIIVVLAHPCFRYDWSIVVTIVAYLTLLEGLTYLFAPEFGGIIRRIIIKNRVGYYTIAILSLIVALYLGFYGFFH